MRVSVHGSVVSHAGAIMLDTMALLRRSLFDDLSSPASNDWSKIVHLLKHDQEEK